MKLHFTNALSIMLTTALVLTSCKPKEVKSQKNTTANYTTQTGKSLCESNWFPHKNTPAPLEGKGSPFDKDSTTNAIFHQWSWQKFLWLTKPKGILNTPLFLNDNTIHQVSTEMKKVIPTNKSHFLILNVKDNEQAGSGGVLKTNPNYGKESTVYYSLHMNDIMIQAADSIGALIAEGKIDKNNYNTFPVGSFELKASWVNIQAIPKEKRKNYFTTEAPLLNGYKPSIEKFALLGIHIVGVVENHPEFIWATFEHDDLAPNFNWKAQKATSIDEKLLFQASTINTIDGIKWDTITKSPKAPFKAYDLFHYGVPKNPDGTFMETSQDGKINFENIDSINTCVKQKLEDKWKNYFYNGSIWIDTDNTTPKEQAERIVNSKLSSAEKGSYTRGSLNCANVTMETYTQTFKNSLPAVNVSNLANCFSCHNSNGYTKNTKSPMYLSHTFNSFLSTLHGKSIQEIEALKTTQELLEATK